MRFQAGRHLSLCTHSALLAGDARQSLHENKGLNIVVRYPCLQGSHCSMESEPGAMGVQCRGVYRDYGTGEQIDAVIVSIAPQEAIEGSAVIGPVTDTDQSLASILQLLAAGLQMPLSRVQQQVCLARIELIAHVGRDVSAGQSRRMIVTELNVTGHPAKRPHR